MEMDEMRKQDEMARAALLSRWDGHVSGVLLEEWMGRKDQGKVPWP